MIRASCLAGADYQLAGLETIWRLAAFLQVTRL
jgi:hypothetical protein